ncbi:MAG: glycosyltransferase family 39 protein [Anaerolineales bacterium]|jgi:4-amino-4-deoxy-L-arabinose transferase-like glycosyltransferase
MKKKSLFILLILLVFFAGLSIRVYDLTDEPLETHMVRQLRSLLITRSIYQGEGLGDEALIEPPIMELTSAFFYNLAGEETPWVQRIISITFWMLGGLALFDLGKTISSRFGALVSIVYYLFLPFSIIYSRLMMPDPMLTAGTVLAVWSLVQWEQRRTLGWAAATGLLTGYAILVKSVAGFILLPAFALFLLGLTSFKNLVKDKQTWVIAGLAALPSVLYYLYGVYFLGTLGSQFKNRFFLDLLTDPAHYVRWLNVVDQRLGLGIVMLAIMGTSLIKEKKYKLLTTGWFAGYLIYGLVFPYHIWTHDYYHLPLVPLTALALAPLGSLVYDIAAKNKDTRRSSLALITIALLVYILPNLWNARVELASDDFREEARHYLPIEEALAENLDEEMIALSGDYSYRLNYFTQVDADSWPSAADFRLKELSGSGFNFIAYWEETLKTYRFFIILSPNELESQGNLAEKLSQYAIFYESGGVVIYDLEQPLDSGAGS